MRKKNVPKSSTDVTDSNGASNSEDEIEESKSSESEPEIRTKRKRQVVSKKSSNDDDDDEDYPKPYVFILNNHANNFLLNKYNKKNEIDSQNLVL